ncbi:MAG: DeoR/GlpR family DNA-binding transcription regulator [Bacteroidales bacterium]
MTKILQNSNANNLNERHEYILDILRKQSSVSVTSFASQLNVSEVTIRKDLSYLESLNLLYRAHGFAILINPYINDRHVNEKEKINTEKKRAIGIKAASLITDNDSIIIASGTTVLSLAREIKTNSNLTVVTAAVNVASILSRDKNIDVIQLGGILRNSSVSAVGPYAEKMMQEFSCSKLFVGVDGFDIGYGLTTTNLMEANLNRMMIKAAQKVIVLADSSKFGLRGFSKICDISDIDHVITDDEAPKHYIEKLNDIGIEVSIVKE